MSQLLFEYYPVSPATWAYLSSLLMIGLFFKFSRFWSVRNLDLLMLILLAPGLLIIHFAQLGTRTSEVASLSETSDTATDDEDAVTHVKLPTASERKEFWGYFWLLSVGLLWLARMILDTGLTRRPLLSPNLSVGGMAFIGVALFVFLAAHVVYQSSTISQNPTSMSELVTARMEQVLRFQSPERGPGNAALDALPLGANQTIAILSHLAVIVGLVMVAWRHFGNATNGIGAATLYLMLPYTSQMTGRIDHCLPAALLVWAVFFYCRPLISGIFIGAAFGCIYYPMFLVPLWFAFYWRRGWIRFLVGVVISLLAMMLTLRLTTGSGSFLGDLQRMLGVLIPAMTDLEGVWNMRIGGWDPIYRLPVLCATAVLALSLLIWPAQKNLATLISCSAAVMLASQFWHGFGGGLFIAWYLPLTLLMVFRPNLEDRVAQTVVKSPRKRKKLVPAETAK